MCRYPRRLPDSVHEKGDELPCGRSRPGAAADLLPSNDPLPICCGCPETYITGIVFDGRRTKMGSIGAWRF